MAKPENAVAINGFKHRSWKKADGFWTDPFVEFDFWSRSFLPEGTLTIEATDEPTMIAEIKKGDMKFKEKDLSKATKKKFANDKDLDYKVDKLTK